MGNYDKIATLVSKVQNARFGEMVRYIEELMMSDWQDFTTKIGTRFQFRECEFDYFLVSMEIEPALIRAAYSYAPDVEALGAKELHLADITGRGKPVTAEQRRPCNEIVASLADDRSGAAARILQYQQSGDRFVRESTQLLARDKRRRRAAEQGRNVPRTKPNQKRWDVRWHDERTPAEVIVEKLLTDDVLARDVYKRLHSRNVANAARDKRRSGS